MKQRVSIQLQDATEIKWNEMKQLHTQVQDCAKDHDVELSDLEWDDINHVKRISYETYSMQDFTNFAQICKSRCEGQNLKIEIILSEDISGVRELISDLKKSTNFRLLN